MGSLDSQDQPEVSFPSTKDKLRNLILRSLNVDYISESCQDNIQTGNHYQSVTLGDKQTTGFRTDRKEILDQIDFQDKKVLDLGSNLGEMSRAARDRGAYVVDGFEYDTYFLETANLINAYNDVTRVSFHHRDITNPAIYTERYDIVLAFSVFTYVHSVLKQVAMVTDQLLILETHKLNENLYSDYIEPTLRYFPYYKILGESEWSIHYDVNERRAVIAFAKRESGLTALNTALV